MNDKQKIVIVGSGDRVQRAVLPALFCLQDQFEVVSVVGRDLEKLARLATRWDVATTTELSSIDFEKIDLIFLAVNKFANPEVLQLLLDHGAGQCVLMIETPVLEPAQLGAANLLKRFRQTWVAEDTIALPHWRIAEQLIADGRIGRLKKIWLHNSGYRYHALARIRHLAGGVFVRRSRLFRYAGATAELNITLSNRVKATITEPHTRAHQQFMIAGSQAVISNFPIYPRSTTDSFNLGNEIDGDGRLRGFTLNGELLPADGRDQQLFDHFPYDKVDDHSMWNLHKIRGLIELLAATAEPNNRYRYSAQDGLYDTLAMKVMRRFPWFDPFTLGGGSIIPLLLRLRGG